MTADTKAVVISKLTSYCDQNNVVPVVDGCTQLSELELDSLALMEVVYELEEELGLVLDPADLSGLDTVAELIAVVNRARKNAA